MVKYIDTHITFHVTPDLQRTSINWIYIVPNCAT